MELWNQVLVTSEGDKTRVTFDQPLRIPNKVALRALYYPPFSLTRTYYLYLSDEAKELVALPILVHDFHESSNDLVWEILSAIDGYCNENDRDGPEFTDYEDPRSVISISGRAGEDRARVNPSDSIYMTQTGLEIITGFDFQFHSFRPTPYNVIKLFDAGTVNSGVEGITIRHHKLKQQPNSSDEVLVLVHCNVTSRSYLNSIPVQILGLIRLKKGTGYNEVIIENPIFRDTVFDEILSLEIEIKTLSGKDLYFRDLETMPLVADLIFR